MRGRTRAVCTLLAAALGSPAWAQDPAYTAPQPGEAVAWLERTLGVRAPRLIELSDTGLVALTEAQAQPPSNWRLTVHLESFGGGEALVVGSSDMEVFVNCPSRRFHVGRIETFAENGDRGAQSTTFGASDWPQAVPGSREARIIAAVCGPPTVAIRTTPPPQTATAAPAPPVPVPAAAPQRAPEAKPAADARAAAEPPAPAAGPAPGRAKVQLFAAAKREIAERFAAGLRARAPLASGRPLAVEAATVQGRTVYRVLIGGMASDAEAARLCLQFKAAGQDCIVRR